MRSDKVPSSSYETRDSSDGVTTIYRTSHLTPDLLHPTGVHPSASVCALSKELKKRGFGFMAPTTVLSFMQVAQVVRAPVKSHV